VNVAAINMRLFVHIRENIVDMHGYRFMQSIDPRLLECLHNHCVEVMEPQGKGERADIDRTADE
jgi:hypothetical protein